VYVSCFVFIGLLHSGRALLKLFCGIRVKTYVEPTDLYIYILDAVPSVHVVSNCVNTAKLTTANGRTFPSSSASLISQ